MKNNFTNSLILSIGYESVISFLYLFFLNFHIFLTVGVWCMLCKTVVLFFIALLFCVRVGIITKVAKNFATRGSLRYR